MKNSVPVSFFFVSLLFLLILGCSRNEKTVIPLEPDQDHSSAYTGFVPSQSESSTSQVTPLTNETGGFFGSNDPISVRRILDGMLLAYRNAQTYRDQGEIQVTWKQNGKSFERKTPYQTSFQRPNRLRLQIGSNWILADGSQFRVWLSSQPGLLLEKPGPKELGFQDILFDQQMYALMTEVETSTFSCLPPPLVLLWAKDPLATLLAQADQTRITLLLPETYETHECWRLALARGEETSIFWIDSNSFVLRRVELPSQLLLKETKKGNKPEEMMVTLNFHDAELNWVGTVEQEVQPDLTKVCSFLDPQISMLGHSYAFDSTNIVSLNGKRITRETQTGKTTFLFYWSIYETSQKRFNEITLQSQQFKSRPDVEFIGICIDPPTVSNQKIATAAEKLGLKCTLARETQSNRKRLNIQALAYVLIDTKGIVQLCETYNAVKPSAYYARQMQRVLEGCDIYPEKIRELLHSEQVFHESMQAWVEKGVFLKEVEPEQISISAKKIAPATKPVVCQLSEYWKNTEIQSPTGILPIPEKQKVFVLSDGKKIVELTSKGISEKEYVLQVQEGDFCQKLLKIPAEATGKYVYAAVGKRVYVFDEVWNVSFVYPPLTGTPKNPVSDALIDDLDGDGILELYTAFKNEDGIHKTALDGTEIGLGNGVTNVFQIISFTQNEKKELRVVDQSGDISVFNPQSMLLTESQKVPQRVLSSIKSFRFGSEATDSLVGISLGTRVKFKVVGLTELGEEIWNIDLPNYIYQRNIEKIQPLFLQRHDKIQSGWVLLGADSSVFLVEPGGILIDQFHFGELITGCASAIFEETPLLFIAAPDSVTAFVISEL